MVGWAMGRLLFRGGGGEFGFCARPEPTTDWAGGVLSILSLSYLELRLAGGPWDSVVIFRPGGTYFGGGSLSFHMAR